MVLDPRRGREQALPPNLRSARDSPPSGSGLYSSYPLSGVPSDSSDVAHRPGTRSSQSNARSGGDDELTDCRRLLCGRTGARMRAPGAWMVGGGSAGGGAHLCDRARAAARTACRRSRSGRAVPPHRCAMLRQRGSACTAALLGGPGETVVTAAEVADAEARLIDLVGGWRGRAAHAAPPTVNPAPGCATKLRPLEARPSARRDVVGALGRGRAVRGRHDGCFERTLQAALMPFAPERGLRHATNGLFDATRCSRGSPDPR